MPTSRTMTFFHTAPSNEAVCQALMSELAPDIPTRHVICTEALDRATAEGCVTEDIFDFTATRMRAAIDADTAVLVCTCSTIGAVADHCNSAEVPVLRIDRPMARKAATCGNRVLIAACLPSTVQPTEQLVRQEGIKYDSLFHTETLLIPEAWPLWQAGDKPGYWRTIAERLRPLARQFDAVVLAQASMSGAAELLKDMEVPVLSSPRLGVAGAVEVYRRQQP